MADTLRQVVHKLLFDGMLLVAPDVVEVLIDRLHQVLFVFERLQPLHHVLVLLEVSDMLSGGEIRHYGHNIAVEEAVDECAKQDQEGHENAFLGRNGSDVSNGNMGYGVHDEIQAVDVEAQTGHVIQGRVLSHAQLLRHSYPPDPRLSHIVLELAHRDPDPCDHVADDVIKHHHLNDSPLLHIATFQLLEYLDNWHDLHHSEQAEPINDDQWSVNFIHLENEAEGDEGDCTLDDLCLQTLLPLDELVFVIHQGRLDEVLAVDDVASSLL